MATPLQIAQQAASEAFDEYLGPRNGAAMHIPEVVVRAAQIAYASAGGKSGLTVSGHGNSTHPVYSVEVSVDRSKDAAKELADSLRKYARDIDRAATQP